MGYVETPWHIVLLLLIALLLFGGKKLPEIGRSLGSGVREFKDGIAGGDTTGRPSQAASDATPIASESETV